jgi:hypothetical protein
VDSGGTTLRENANSKTPLCATIPAGTLLVTHNDSESFVEHEKSAMEHIIPASMEQTTKRVCIRIPLLIRNE